MEKPKLTVTVLIQKSIPSNLQCTIAKGPSVMTNTAVTLTEAPVVHVVFH